MTPKFLEQFENWLETAVNEINQEHRMGPRTIADQLKAAKAELLAAREHAATVAVHTAEATRIVRIEVDKALKEAADLRAEVAELTNGGPA